MNNKFPILDKLKKDGSKLEINGTIMVSVIMDIFSSLTRDEAEKLKEDYYLWNTMYCIKYRPVDNYYYASAQMYANHLGMTIEYTLAENVRGTHYEAVLAGIKAAAGVI